MQKYYEYCRIIYIPKDDLTQVRTKLKTRYELGHTVPGTRSYHVFIPQNIGIISFKRIGEDKEISGQHSFFQSQQTSIIPNYQDYVAVKYDHHWWIGLVVAVESVSMKAKIKFMSPHDPTRNFFWSQRDDICWVTNDNILKLLCPLSSTSQSGRTYKLDNADFEAICKLFSCHKTALSM